ncbi:unnamed protein product [Echinostoma caproni]|uniref:Ig-like domain-containing protein n=1 Tax=Echinostoma caproni TaxID=27848 RepID=A0A183AF70_9TREM|nr:unnamed protein product [Echinostoma caproni]
MIKDNISHTFRISSTHRDNAGVYRCVALNAFGGLRSTSLKLEIGYLDPLNPKARSRSLLEVYLGQAVVLWPSSYARIFAPGGTHSELDTSSAEDSTLSVNAVPAPRAKWTMNNGPVPTTTSIYVSLVEQTLVLLNVDWSLDSTVFRAHLVNSYGDAQAQGGVYTQSFILTVKEPMPDAPIQSLHLVLPPKDVTVVLQDGQSGSATFECVFNARPSHALRVRWYHRQVDDAGPSQMQLIHSHDSQSDNARSYRFDRSGLNRSLTVSNIRTPTMSVLTGLVETYMEEFTCQAYLEAYPLAGDGFTRYDDNLNYGMAYMSGPLSATARLRIHVTPRLRLSSSVVPFPVQPGDNLGLQPKAAIVQSSVSATLIIPCEFEHAGHPRATIEWYKNGRRLTPAVGSTRMKSYVEIVERSEASAEFEPMQGCHLNYCTTHALPANL